MTKALSIQNNKLTLSNSESSDLNLFGLVLSQNGVSIPSGNTLQRPSVPEQGMIRFNTSTTRVEGYDGSDWVNII